MKPRVWAFLLYTVWWQSLVWGLFGYAVFFKGYSAWLLILAAFLAYSQFQPERFGLPGPSDEDGEDT